MANYFEPETGAPFDPMALVVSCVESGADSLFLDSEALPAEFFDLSTGAAGELLHNLSKYRLRLAGVVPDPTAHSRRFQDFSRESNRGKQFRFFATRAAALEWLAA